tara:strand:+ start:284 stop:469 length:186 start_codon:yes stop_codon:yes gene_type:complete
VNNLEGQSKQFKSEIFKLMWYMRGSMTMDEAFQMGPEDRKLIADLIKENLETAKKTQMPFF